MPDGRPVPLIRRKVTRPGASFPTIPRPRIVRHLDDLVDDHSVVLVQAGPGAGKTTVVAQWAEGLDRSVGWLTVDHSDQAPGRLLTYLGAALATVCDLPAQLVDTLLASQVPHAEAAGILAESIAGTGAVLVIDDAERLVAPGQTASESVAVLCALARYLPDDCRLVVLSQVAIPLDLGGTARRLRMAIVDARVLAFDAAETRDALELRKVADADPEDVLAATGGWAAAVMFSSWSGELSAAATTGVVDENLGHHILARLSDEQRKFLVGTSLLDTVTAERGRQFGFPRAGTLLAELRSTHLPAVWSSRGDWVRLHPFLRQFLQDLLELEEAPDQIGRLRSMYAQLLLREGRPEEAVDRFAAAGDVAGMSAAIEQALPHVVRRLDFDLATRWLRMLAEHGVASTPASVLAELLIAVGQERYWRVVEIADAMEPALFEQAVLASTTAWTVVLWCYWHLGRLDQAQSLFDRVPGKGLDSALALARATLQLSADDGAVELPTVDLSVTGTLDPIVLRIAYYCGRFWLLVRAGLTSPWAGRVGAAWHVGALRATGRVDEALRSYEQTAHQGTSAWLHAVAYPQTLMDRGSAEEAWAALQRGRELCRLDGSRVHEVMSLLLEARFHLRFNRDVALARDSLERAVGVGRAADYAFLREERLTLLGEAALIDGRVDEAVAQLSAATGTMRAAGRLLHLPRAQVVIAECLWRQGDEAASLEAADRALVAAREQGSNFLLLQALADFPDVVTRGLDGEREPNGRWHALARDLLQLPDRPRVRSSRLVHLRDLGPVELLVESEPARPRIRKSYELLAFLMRHADGAARREAVLDALFDGTDSPSSRSYLRQAVHRLREVLPEGVAVTVDGPVMRLVPNEAFDSDTRALERLRDQLCAEQGEQRLDGLRKVVELVARGPYLADVLSAWADGPRAKLKETGDSALQEAADLAYRLGRYPEAEALVSALLDSDPYRERAWQLAIELASAVGDADRAVRLFQRYRDALNELGLEPSPVAVRALNAIRR